MGAREAEYTPPNAGMSWEAFDDARHYDTYIFRGSDTLVIVRPDGTEAIFDEVNSAGFSVGQNHEVTDDERALVASRALVKQATETVTKLDRFFVLNGESLGERNRPKGDWDPDYDVEPQHLAIAGLSRRQRSKQIRQHRRSISWRQTRQLTNLVEQDRDLAVRLEAPENHGPTAVRLVGFEKKFMLDPTTGKRSWRPVVKIQNKRNEIDIPPSDAVVTGLFVKREDS